MIAVVQSEDAYACSALSISADIRGTDGKPKSSTSRFWSEISISSVRMLYTNKKTKKHTDTTGLHTHILIVHLLAIACDYRIKYKRLCPDFQQYEPISKAG